MSNPVLGENKKHITNLSFVELEIREKLTQRLVKVKH